MTGMVVVITGATAGVGRATALAFARRGAKLGLIARDEAALEDTRAEVAALGAEAETASLDVADAEAVARAADAFENSLGPIDVWVNNAMVTIFSSVEDLTAEEIARVTDVTYLGTVHGTLAALKHMRPRNRGVIVQVGSSLAYRGIPLQAAYCAAKHAVRGFTDSLRVELRQAHSNIHVTAVHLPAINTPQFDWARTRRQKQPRPVAPVFTPEAAAEAIIYAAEHPQREHWLGGMTPVTILANAVFPGLMDRILGAQAIEGQQTEQLVDPDRKDNLFEPVPGKHQTEGRFGEEAKPSAWQFPEQPTRAGALAGACLLAGLAGLMLGSTLSSGRDSRRLEGER
jgi:short-subunit dehydrogenase